MVLRVTTNTRSATKLLTNIRTWMPRAAGKIVNDGASTLRQYARQNIKPHNKTGKLYAGVTVARSPKQFSAWVQVQATNNRGSYARAVEEGGFNPRTGRVNRPVRYMERAINRYVRKHGEVVDKTVRTIPKK